MIMDETDNRQGLLYGALAKAQGGMVNPPKNREVQVRSEKGSYTFSYATLDSILDIIRPRLSENGLSYTQTLERNGEVMVMCLRLYHSGGGMVSSCMPLEWGRISKMQEMGSLISYARRYQIAAFFGLAAEEDDDGNSGDGNHRETRDRTPPQSKGPDARSEYKRIKDEMTAAKSATDLADIILRNKDALLMVKKASEVGYSDLMSHKDKLVEGFANE
jgi:hypothetical protein